MTKKAALAERAVLRILGEQKQPAVPFSHALDFEGPVALICMEDLGDEHRPSSLEPISRRLVRREAEALASIHHANRDERDFPRLEVADRSYVERHLEELWAPAWNRVVHDPDFVREFGDCVDVVEEAAQRVGAGVDGLLADDENISLIHGDINPSNVLVKDGTPGIIDWETAAFGPSLLDLPHHFHTLELAELYRRAREALGDDMPRQAFDDGFRVAAHYTGLRYIWWTLDMWLEDHSESQWVRHYLNLINL